MNIKKSVTSSASTCQILVNNVVLVKHNKQAQAIHYDRDIDGYVTH